MKQADVVIIGGGQAGLATGYFLRRMGLSFVILDGEAGPGAAWRHAWQSVRLFSPAQWSSLPGWPMPPAGADYPPAGHVIDYLARYEARYRLPVQRPVEVRAVHPAAGGLAIEASDGGWLAKAVVSATGTWRKPCIPAYPGLSAFAGTQLHSADYAVPEGFRDRSVLVVGGGNSGAQIAAELAHVAQVHWAVEQPPAFLPDDVDGRVLFQQATARWLALQAGEPPPEPRGGLGSIVMVPAVRAARRRGVFDRPRRIGRFTPHEVIWEEGDATAIDAIVWCTGFRPALDHLAPLGVIDAAGRVAVQGTRATQVPRLWLVGYGEWTGFASATLIGVMRSARQTAEEIGAFLAE